MISSAYQKFSRVVVCALALANLVACAGDPAPRFSGAEGIAIPTGLTEVGWWTEIAVEIDDSAAPLSTTTTTAVPTEPTGTAATTTPPATITTTTAVEPLTEVGVVAPADALFEIDDDTVTADAIVALTTALSDIGSGRVTGGTATCHTDSDGSDAYNSDLSDRRAINVVAALGELDVPLEIDSSLIEPIGMGESEPIADNGTESGRARNRRCELELIVEFER